MNLTFCRENASLSMTRWKMSLQVKNLEWKASYLLEISMLLREQLNFNLLHSDLQNLPPTVSSEYMAIKNPPVIQRHDH